MTNDMKKYYRADPIEVSSNGEEEHGSINMNRTISMRLVDRQIVDTALDPTIINGQTKVEFLA